ncbi:MAG: hypothetical protein D6820_13505 [Lentisphaerae bacterium]|nr:MAG: hypothetical protein D6820_13505 [Lentisphaerota bacterium]
MKMHSKSILFISWQGAMGHVTRDLAIVKELRRIMPQVDLAWMAHPLAAKVIREADEKLLPESEQVADYNLAGLQAVSEFGLDLVKYLETSKEPRQKNVELLKRVLEKYPFDLIIGDEVYETLLAVSDGEIHLTCPLIMIEDFIGVRAMNRRLLVQLGVYVHNRKVVNAIRKTSGVITHLFVGELADVPDRRYGFLLPNCREFARKYYRFLGYIVRFDPAEYGDKARIRKKLGYGDEPLVICATGGTAAGWELIELCGKAYPLLKKEIPDLRMVCVCGERFGLPPPKVPAEVEFHGYIPRIYEHYAACDLAVIVGGGTTSLELTALRKPFLFFPLENQFDQQLYVAERIARHGAGVRMEYRRTTPEALARAIKDNLGRKVETNAIPFDGARKAAEVIVGELSQGQKKQNKRVIIGH